jgi:hypothetical protein
MGDLILTVALLAAVVITGWVAWRVGHDSAQRDSYYTISELRRSLRAAQLEVDRLREHNRLLFDRIDRARLPREEVPEWMK